MKTKEKINEHISLLEAVDALTAISESNLPEVPPFVEVQEEGKINFKDTKWLHLPNKEKVKKVLKEILHVILIHLQNVYAENGVVAIDSKQLETVKALMLLVGEASKKLDHYAPLFKQGGSKSMASFSEYKELQDFYKRKISRTVDEAMLGKWILALTQRSMSRLKIAEEGLPSLNETRHVFVDMESVKKDSEYELFLIRKEDGTRFFSPRLLRNIKLVCDFESYLGQSPEQDRLIDYPIWEDRYYQAYAQSLLKTAWSALSEGYHFIIHHKNEEWAGLVNQMIMSLMLASDKGRLVDANSSKECRLYFYDFQLFLREALVHREYQHYLAFNQKEAAPCMLAGHQIINVMLRALFETASGLKVTYPYLASLFKEGYQMISSEHKSEAEKSGLIWTQLGSDLKAMQKVIKTHPHGPLGKMLNIIEEGNFQGFDPYIQGRTCEPLFHLQESKEVSVHAIPSPTSQNQVNKACIVDEFRRYLHEAVGRGEKLLLLNFQDRTSWREYIRCRAIEELQTGISDNHLLFATLPKDTEFYWQEPPYAEDHRLAVFKDHFIEHLLDPSSGFHLPLSMQLSRSWFENIFDGVSRLFFSSKNVLTKEARCDFIEIFYQFLNIKLIRMAEADHLFLICKDGLDVSLSHASELLIFSQMAAGKELGQNDLELLRTLIYLPPLIARERLMLPDRFQRMLNSLRIMEHAFHEIGGAPFKENVEGLILGE